MALVIGCPIPGFGMRRDTFGHTVITNVGPMGYNATFAPLCPPLHQMSMLCCGAITKKAICDKNDGDKIKVASMMTVIAAGDHRYGDAAIMNPFFKNFRAFVEDPAGYDER